MAQAGDEMADALAGQARLDIDLAALATNWRLFRDAPGGGACAAVVKADGYGLGAAPVARALVAQGCDSFFVAHTGEGVALRAALGAGPRVFVLNGPAPGEEPLLAAHALAPVLNHRAQVEGWQAHAPGGPCAVHVDTGMNRLGLAPEEAVELAPVLASLDLVLVMSHLACGSDPRHPLNPRQRDLFVETAARLPPAALSLSASAGALLGPAYRFDLVRPGIGLYGGAPFDDAPVPLLPVASLDAPVIQLRDIGPGDTVGYGATWEAPRARRIAIVALGYADGFLRSGSNRGFGVWRGAVCPIVGRVSMDLIALDVTQAKGLAPGDRMAFLGPSAPLDAQAQACGTIAYELLTRLGPRLHRVWHG